nr:reverse transcriptase domain-containing protein [Tanacetum cinerariifolium]
MTDYLLWELKFNTHKDAKTLMEAIEKRFGGNTKTKKVQKTLLKQQYENFTGSSSESLDQIHDRLQKLVSQLEILGRNKTYLEEQSLDDLFNSLKIYEAEVKSSSSVSTYTQNIAFVSSSNTDSTNEPVSAAASVSAVSAKIPVSTLPDVDTLSNAVIYPFFASQFNSPQLDNDDLKQIDADDLEEMELKWQMDMKGQFIRECRSPKDTRRNGAAEPQRRNVPVENSTSNALVSQCDGVGSYDWSFQAEEEPTNYALLAFTSLSSFSNNELNDDYRKSQFDVISYKTRLESVEARLQVYQQNGTVFEEDIKLLKLEVQLRDNALVVLKQNLKKAEQERDDLKLKLEKFQTSSKNLSDLLASQTNAKTGLGYNSQVFTRAMFDCDDYCTSESDESLPPSPIYDRYQSENGYNVVPPPYTRTFMPPKPDLVFHNAPNDVETVLTTFNVELSFTNPDNDLSHTHRPSAPIIEDWVSDLDDESETKIPQNLPILRQPFQSPQAMATTGIERHALHVVPTAVVPKSKLVPINVARPITAAVPKINVTRPRQDKPIVTKPNSPPRRHINRSPSPKSSTFPPKVTAVKGNPQHALKDKGVIDSGCSRYMIRNMSYLFDFEELNGGYVAFGGNPKGGKISGKEKAGEENVQQYVLFLMWPSGFTNPLNTDGDAAFEVKVHEFEGRKPESEVNVSPSSSEFEDFYDNNINEDNAAELEDITYSDDEDDVGAEADFTNLETTITVSPIQTTRVHKDHHVTQIIGDLSLATQTRSMTRVAKDQGFKDLDYPDKVYKVVKALYGLHLGPRAWYETLANYVGNKMHKAFPLPRESSHWKYKFPLPVEGVPTARRMEIPLPGSESKESSTKTALSKAASFEALYGKKCRLPGCWSEVGDSQLTGPKLICETMEKIIQIKNRLLTTRSQQKNYADVRQKPMEFDVGVNTPRCDEDRLELMELTIFLLPSDKKVRIEVSAVDQQVYALRLILLLLVQKFLLFGLTNWCCSLNAARSQNKKKVIITKATLRDALYLDDAEGIECLPNEEIFAELARMGYEKPSTKLTFYKEFFSSQVGKGFSRVETPFFKGMIVEQQVDEGHAKMNVEDVSTAGVAAKGDVSATDDVVPTAVDEPSIPSPTPPTPPLQSLQDQPSTFHDAGILMDLLQNLMDTCKTLTRRVEYLEQDKIAQALEITKLKQRGRMIADMDADVDVILEDAKEVVVEKSADVDESADVQGRKAESQAQIYQIDSEHANKRKQKEDNAVKRYQALKRKPQTEAQARKNMMIYLRNVAGFKMDYLKGMTYDDIRPIFEKHFNSNVAFLLKTKEQIDEEDSRALKRLSESQEDKAAKKQKLDEEVEELRKHLMIVPNKEDDVYTEETHLARKVPVVDYEIYNENNKPYYKIKRVDGSHQLYLSFLSMLRNFDIEDLEVLWQLVKERFTSTKPKNFFDDFLLITLEAMFEKPDIQAQI